MYELWILTGHWYKIALINWRGWVLISLQVRTTYFPAPQERALVVTPVSPSMLSKLPQQLNTAECTIIPSWHLHRDRPRVVWQIYVKYNLIRAPIYLLIPSIWAVYMTCNKALQVISVQRGIRGIGVWCERVCKMLVFKFIKSHITIRDWQQVSEYFSL